jgi:capsid assembly protease
MSLPSRLAMLSREPLAITSEGLSWAISLWDRAARGEEVSDAEVQAATGNQRPPTRSSTGRIAVVPIYGVIMQRADYRWETSTEEVGAVLDSLIARPDVDSIVLDINSPGGTVSGTPELAAKIFNARGEKKIVAVANSMAASAAYWIGSAASEFVVTPSGAAGSIGVWNMHIDQSKMLDSVGVKATIVSAGKYKVEGNPLEPLGEEARAEMQRVVDEYYDQFVSAVALHRGVTSAAVRSGYGEGRVLTASRAKEAGLVDRIDTMAKVFGRLGASNPNASRQRAEIARHRINLTQIQ